MKSSASRGVHLLLGSSLTAREDGHELVGRHEGRAHNLAVDEATLPSGPTTNTERFTAISLPPFTP